MPRGPRLDAPDALHHIIARGIDRGVIFRDDVDRHGFLQRLAAAVAAGDLTVYAWALIPNHFHLLARTGVISVSRAMQRLLGGYAAAFNLRHGRVGYLFQGRFKSTVVDADGYLLALLRYIHLNPLRAGLVTDLDTLDAYEWSGHAVLLGYHARPWQDTAFVLQHFGGTIEGARGAYRRFVAAGLAQPAPDLDGGGLRRSQGAWETIDTLERGRERWTFDERVLGRSEFVTTLRGECTPGPRPLAAQVDPATFVPDTVQRVAAYLGVEAREISTNSRRRVVVRARALVCYLTVRLAGLPARRVAPLLGVSARTVLDGVSLAERRYPRPTLASLTSLLPPSPSG